MKDTIKELLVQLNTGFIGRDAVIKSALLSLIAGENILLVGPPGTGKSMLSRRISEALASEKNTDKYFEYLLTKFSTPEEIFGPLSLSDLKQDRFHRKTTGYLPTVQIAFLDEIFKASSSILNALLTILNEKIYHNGTNAEVVPIHCLIAASNELPNGQDELSALYDRFLMRKFVDYVDEDQIQQLFNLPLKTTIESKYQLRNQQIEEVRQQANQVIFPNEIQNLVMQIWKKCKAAFKENKDEVLSDRRLIKVLHLLRISAVTNGRNQVDYSDVMLLKDCVWNHPDNAKKVLDIILKSMPIRSRVKEVEPQFHHPDLKGNGTKKNPFKISNSRELQLLNHWNIGMQGFYFEQTQDIPILKSSFFDLGYRVSNSIYSFAVIQSFKGHYDGKGFGIALHHRVPTGSSIYSYFVFEHIENVEIQNIHLQDHTMLAYKSKDSVVINCTHKKMKSLIGTTPINTIFQNQPIKEDQAETIEEPNLDQDLIKQQLANNIWL